LGSRSFSNRQASDASWPNHKTTQAHQKFLGTGRLREAKPTAEKLEPGQLINATTNIPKPRGTATLARAFNSNLQKPTGLVKSL
jgi:hypothetical protein